MDSPKKTMHTYDQQWLKTYLRLLDSNVMTYPQPAKKCFYCRTTSSLYVIEIVVDHLVALDFRTAIPLHDALDFIRTHIESAGITSITDARHLVTICVTCHLKAKKIGWTI